MFFYVHYPSSGEHTGYVTSVENSGFIFNTSSAYFKTNTQSSQEDKYCVTDPEIISELKQYQESNQNITIEFSNGFLCHLGSVNTQMKVLLLELNIS